MSDRVFVDSNILVYAHDSGAGERHRVAAELVRQLWQAGSAGVGTPYSEDLNAGQSYDSVVVVNPFG